MWSGFVVCYILKVVLKYKWWFRNVFSVKLFVKLIILYHPKILGCEV